MPVPFSSLRGFFSGSFTFSAGGSDEGAVSKKSLPFMVMR